MFCTGRRITGRKSLNLWMSNSKGDMFYMWIKPNYKMNTFLSFQNYIFIKQHINTQRHYEWQSFQAMFRYDLTQCTKLFWLVPIYITPPVQSRVSDHLLNVNPKFTLLLALFWSLPNSVETISLFIHYVVHYVQCTVIFFAENLLQLKTQIDESSYSEPKKDDIKERLSC